MANQIDTAEFSTLIKSPADKFYNFFKYDMNDLVKIDPQTFKSVQLLQGEEGTVGSIKIWTYVLGGITMSVKVKTEVIDDAGKMITLSVLEGDVLQLYKSFKVTISVADGSVKWSIVYEKASILSPSPELYGAVAIAASALVDIYLLNNI